MYSQDISCLYNTLQTNMMEESDNAVQCTVCKTTPTAPRLFPCGHVICAKCLADTISDGYDADGDPKPDSHTRCPTCRKEFAVSSGALEQLPVKKITRKEPETTVKQHTERISVVADPPPERGISFTSSSKSMIPAELISHKDVVNTITIDDEKRPPTEIFTTSVTAKSLQNGSMLPDIMDARLPLQSLVAAKATEDEISRGSDQQMSEEEIRLDDDNRSNTSTELTNFCSICKLSGKYGIT